MRAAAGQLHFVDNAAATASAGLAGAAIDLQMFHHGAPLAGCRHISIGGRALFADGQLENSGNRLPELFDFRGGQLAGRARRHNAAGEQRLVGVNVAYAGDERLVH